MSTGVGTSGGSDHARSRLVERLKRRGRIFDDRWVPIRSRNLGLMLAWYLPVGALVGSMFPDPDGFLGVFLLLFCWLPTMAGIPLGFLTMGRRSELGDLLGAATLRAALSYLALFVVFVLCAGGGPIDRVGAGLVAGALLFLPLLPLHIAMIGLGARLRTWEPGGPGLRAEGAGAPIPPC